MYNIALFGPPGAGKGTLAKNLINKYNFIHISTGDMIRREIAEGTELGKRAESIIGRGELLSDELVIEMIKSKMDEADGDIYGFIFDGFPRTVKQAESLSQMLNENGFSLDAFVKLEVPRPVLIERMLKRAKIENRPDDTEEVIINRFKEYEAKTLPVFDYFNAKGVCFEIEAVDTPENILTMVEKTLNITI